MATATNQLPQSGNRVLQKHIGNTTVKPVQNVMRPQAKTQPKTNVQTRTSVHQLSAVHSPIQKPGIKPTITRVVKNAPNANTSTPEQKIAALTRQGNIKITRKSVNAKQSIAVDADNDEFCLYQSQSTQIEPKVEQQEQQPQILTTQILGQVGASGSSVALIDASHLEQNLELKKEGDDITLNEEQLQQLQQAGGIVTDQDGLQQILAANEDGSQQLIQFVTGEDGM